jgi:hypothetical protein
MLADRATARNATGRSNARSRRVVPGLVVLHVEEDPQRAQLERGPGQAAHERDPMIQDTLSDTTPQRRCEPTHLHGRELSRTGRSL